MIHPIIQLVFLSLSCFYRYLERQEDVYVTQCFPHGNYVQILPDIVNPTGPFVGNLIYCLFQHATLSKIEEMATCIKMRCSMSTSSGYGKGCIRFWCIWVQTSGFLGNKKPP